ncbi:MAG: pilus assembly protein TadG-related protein, partial [Actinomycetota bacterium]
MSIPPAHKPRAPRDGERGAVLILMAGALVALLTFAAFAVDLGWILLNRSKLQTAADAAALAGVVNLPGFPDDAEDDAMTAASLNGFPVGARTAMDTTVEEDNRYKVGLTTSVDTFFLTVIGMDTVDVARDATAEYIKPVRLGSPNNQFGGPGENFWAAVNGRYTEIQQGDPY